MSTMEFGTSNNFSHNEFFLIGFSSLKEYRRLLFLPFCMLFIFAITTNMTLVSVIVKQRTLHSPMYVLICFIACVDICVPTCVVPRMLFSFVSEINVLPRTLCLIQMFLVHYACSFQSTILFGMAMDRYFAICMPLRYNDVMNFTNCMIITGLIVVRNTIIITAMIALVGTLTFCSSNVLYHVHCEHQLVVTLAIPCEDTTKNYFAGLISFCVPTIDCIGIALSYITIFVVIFRSAAGESRSKAISTCITHLIVICITYFSSLVAFMAYRAQSGLSPDLRVLISLTYLLVPGVCNPVIYGIRTKEIRDQLIKLFKINKLCPLSRHQSLLLSSPITQFCHMFCLHSSPITQFCHMFCLHSSPLSCHLPMSSLLSLNLLPLSASCPVLCPVSYIRSGHVPSSSSASASVSLPR
ncbi:olfactory receptor 52P1-like [Hoplias malabaricus]|uniref:olfactory receptor 52P1-like n=1 Tax=Hoplias malabaricus TaxID=27720 RepID=UPI003462B0BF